MAIAPVIALLWPMLIDMSYSWWNPRSVMAGTTYFYDGEIPWLGWSVSLTLAAAFLFTAVRIFERRDL